MQFFSILLGKLTASIIQTLFKRSASTWPGHLVLESNPSFIKNILNKNPQLKIILIAGTNGKTTTTKALNHILESNGYSVIRNDSGANLLNGFASLLIRCVSLNGKIRKEILLFEVDENSLPLLLDQLSTFNSQLTILLLNLFRDQLDRYGEINTTAEKWKEALESVDSKTIVVANADDPQIVNITKSLKNKFYFSVDDKLKIEKTLSHAVDSTTCPNCRNQLTYFKIAYSHIGNYKCSNCKFTNPESEKYDIKTKLKGVFNIYNLTSAILTAEKTTNIKPFNSIPTLENFKPAFGRQEEISFNGKKILLLLSKNPTGFNESLKVVLENKYSNILILLNDRIPDGRDISWIWDVDFEILSNKKYSVVASGDRTYDMANRLNYAEINSVQTIEKVNDALDKALSTTPKNETLVILPTYSAMLEIRKLLTGKSIL